MMQSLSRLDLDIGTRRCVLCNRNRNKPLTRPTLSSAHRIAHSGAMIVQLLLALIIYLPELKKAQALKIQSLSCTFEHICRIKLLAGNVTCDKT
ncbi:hypothetical protein P692DRAFT_201345890 [Suillus brevipes Sb2]|jgi:hypothetical protein|nr:hypothetical protein P692DRAFT_201345890 [Suillus brevipes Sb2]